MGHPALAIQTGRFHGPHHFPWNHEPRGGSIEEHRRKGPWILLLKSFSKYILIPSYILSVVILEIRLSCRSCRRMKQSCPLSISRELAEFCRAKKKWASLMTADPGEAEIRFQNWQISLPQTMSSTSSKFCALLVHAWDDRLFDAPRRILVRVYVKGTLRPIGNVVRSR